MSEMHSLATDVRERTLAGLPVTERRLDLAGVSTALLEGGDGPAVVLLHGPGEFATLWGRVIPDLVKTHRVLAPDLPGHGASGMPVGRLDSDRVLAWLDALIERECPSPPALVGHLLGGAIAARFAVGRRDRVSRLVLVDTFGLAPNRPALRFAMPLMAFLARPTERTRDRFLAQCFLDFDGLREQMGGGFEPYGRYALAWARTKTAKAALRSLVPEFGLRAIPPDVLAQITVPTTLIWGRHDLQTRLDVAEAAARRYGWPLHVIENARDDPCFEQPTDALRALRAALGHV
ncbi:alpha/beta fold hydrolase [Streptomyces sp. HUAS ZL42]|uniref:alpha/beta fold hydrolase n=1 Tax=Streptomyces sp. HUAS ZL42 TaxID=3231715 RepID=UPI00345EE142